MLRGFGCARLHAGPRGVGYPIPDAGPIEARDRCIDTSSTNAEETRLLHCNQFRHLAHEKPDACSVTQIRMREYMHAELAGKLRLGKPLEIGLSIAHERRQHGDTQTGTSGRTHSFES